MMLTRAAIAIAGVALAGTPVTAAAQQEEGVRFQDYTPARCAVAARVMDAIHRHERRDTAIYSPAGDTLFTATTRSLRECEKAYGGATDDAGELLNVARVQRMTGQDQAAIATTARHLARFAGSPAEERAWELYLVVSDNLAGKPARLAEARKALEEMDRLGPKAAGTRVMAHYAVLKAAIQHGDDALMRREADAVRAAWLEMPEADRMTRYVYFENAMLSRAAVEALAKGPDAAISLLEETMGILVPDPRLPPRWRGFIQMYRQIGKKAAPFDAQFWYNTGATGPNRPAPGRVSLALTLRRPCTEIANCLRMVDASRRLEREFGNRGLDLTFRTRTFGFYADTAPASPLAEAKWDSAYFLHHVKIPGALAIAETPFSFKPDGRRVNEPTVDDLNYPGVEVILVDRKGIIRYVAPGWDPVLESRITALIRRLIDEDPGGT